MSDLNMTRPKSHNFYLTSFLYDGHLNKQEKLHLNLCVVCIMLI
jgi:hypothetical protein